MCQILHCPSSFTKSTPYFSKDQVPDAVPSGLAPTMAPGEYHIALAVLPSPATSTMGVVRVWINHSPTPRLSGETLISGYFLASASIDFFWLSRFASP